MGRRQLDKENDTKVGEAFNVSVAIDRYGQLKEEESQLKKDIKPLNDEIKDYMSKHNVDEFISDQFTAKLSERTNEDFNEDKAIEILKDSLTKEQLASVIKTKEYIDDDALEALVYEGAFDLSQLDSCRVEKAPTITLRVSRTKK